MAKIKYFFNAQDQIYSMFIFMSGFKGKNIIKQIIIIDKEMIGNHFSSKRNKSKAFNIKSTNDKCTLFQGR